MLLKKYKVNPNITEEQLTNYGFCKTKDGYLLRVSAYKYKKKVSLLYLNFLITYKNDDTSQLIVDCKDNNGKWYIPFYNSSYNEDNLVLKAVNKQLKITINDLAKNNIINTKIKYTQNKHKT